MSKIEVISIEVPVDMEIDLTHMLEAVSDAAYWADNVTEKEQKLVIKMIKELRRQGEKYYGD